VDNREGFTWTVRGGARKKGGISPLALWETRGRGEGEGEISNGRGVLAVGSGGYERGR